MRRQFLSGDESGSARVWIKIMPFAVPKLVPIDENARHMAQREDKCMQPVLGPDSPRNALVREMEDEGRGRKEDMWQHEQEALEIAVPRNLPASSNHEVDEADQTNQLMEVEYVLTREEARQAPHQIHDVARSKWVACFSTKGLLPGGRQSAMAAGPQRTGLRHPA